MSVQEDKIKQSQDEAKARPWFLDVEVGQKLRPDPLWNQCERPRNRLAVPTEVLAIEKAVSQSGIVFHVKSVDGSPQRLDAGWFEPPAKNTNE